MKTDSNTNEAVMQIVTTPHIVLSDISSNVRSAHTAELRSAHTTAVADAGRSLLLAARNGDTNAVRQIIAKGAPFTTDWLGTSALHLAAGGGHAECAAALLRAGAQRDARTKVDRTPLHVASYHGHTTAVNILLQHGADVHATDLLRMTALHWAAERGHSDVVASLLRAGADPNARSKFHKTPLQLGNSNSRVRNLMLDELRRRNDQDTRDVNNTDAQPSADPLFVEAEPVPVTTTGNNTTTSNTWSPSGGATGGTAGAALLRRHGITLLPKDEGSTVLNALQSGRTVVLSDAGKLMLKESSATKKADKCVPIRCDTPPEPAVSGGGSGSGVVLTATPVSAPPPAGVKVFTISSTGRRTTSNTTGDGMVRIIMSRRNLRKLIAQARTTNTAALEATASDSDESDDDDSVVAVPEQFVRSTSAQYLRSQLLCAHAAIHRLSRRLRRARAREAHRQSEPQP